MPFTVKDLIASLQRFDPESEVFLSKDLSETAFQCVGLISQELLIMGDSGLEVCDPDLKTGAISGVVLWPEA